MNRNYILHPALTLMMAGAIAGCGSSDDTSNTGSSGGAGTATTSGSGGQAGSIGTGGSSGSSGAGGVKHDGGSDASQDGSLVGDAATEATVSDASSSDGDGGCLASQKTCAGACVAKSDPAYGCTDTGCVSCNMTTAATCAPVEAGALDLTEAGLYADATTSDAGAALQVCSGPCSPGYEDLDGLATNGCETKTPKLIQATSLQLWLRSDRDMSCGADAGVGDLVLWKDQSGKGHDATTPLTATVGGAKPQCTAAVGGISNLPVVHFTRSGDYTKDDGTLAVDLSFLAGSDYTVFAVERRTDVVAGEQWLLGSIAPGVDCSVTSYAQKGFRFGYRSNTELDVGQLCGGNLVATVAGADVTNKPVSLDVGWFSKTAVTGGHKLEVGVVSTSDMAVVPVSSVTGGALGRGYVTTADTRFQGDVAEVVVYAASLSDADRNDVKAYLKAHWKL